MPEETPVPVVVVTGGSAGVGLAVCRRFARVGYRLSLCGRDAAALTAAHDELEKVAPDVLAMQLDLFDFDAAPNLIASTLERYGRIDVVVNSAGHAPVGPLDQVGDEDFRRALAVNCEATFQTTRAAWDAMRAQGGGTIVNLSAALAADPPAGLGVFAACKAWVNTFTRATAAEGRPHDIRAFALALGPVRTRLLDDLAPGHPAARALDPDEVADLVLALTGPTFRHASGQTLDVFI